MSNTALYTEIEGRLRVLAQRMLPQEFDDFAEYDDVVFDMAKGYCLLAHAEIEDFFERLAFQHVILSTNAWVSSGAPNKCVMAVCLCIAFNNNFLNDEEKVTKKKVNGANPGEVEKLVRGYALNAYRSIVRDNNGIKRKDIVKLLRPTGLLESVSDQDIDVLESLGVMRGSFAHASHSSLGLRTEMDPRSLYNTINGDVKSAIKNIDNVFISSNPELANVNWGEVRI